MALWLRLRTSNAEMVREMKDVGSKACTESQNGPLFPYLLGVCTLWGAGTRVWLNM